MKLQSSQDLLEPTAIYAFNLDNYIGGFYIETMDMYVPPEPGVYIINQREPLLTEKDKVYIKKVNTLVQINPLDIVSRRINTPIYDIDGEIIMTPAMYGKAARLSTPPSHRSNAFQTAKYVATNYIYNSSVDPSIIRYTDACRFVEEPYHTLDADGTFEDWLTLLMEDIYEAISRHRYNMVRLKLIYKTLYLEILGDFRAYKYTVQMEEEQELAESMGYGMDYNKSNFKVTRF